MIESVETELGHNYVRLLIEPSIGCRFGKFLSFSSGLKLSTELPSPLELRSQFKESLGSMKVYRVVAVTEDNMDSIYKDGFIANFYRNRTSEELLRNKDFYESMMYAVIDLQGRVNAYVGFAVTKDSPLISVSEYPQMAKYAAFVRLRAKWTEMEERGYKLYIMPIKIDEFACVCYSEYLPRYIRGKGVWTDGETTIDYEDPGIETFVEFQIPPDGIDFENMEEVAVNNIPKFKLLSVENLKDHFVKLVF